VIAALDADLDETAEMQRGLPQRNEPGPAEQAQRCGAETTVREQMLAISRALISNPRQVAARTH
jgi:ABC-type branched-subunit amino acid transport system ATPase component